MFQFLGFAFDFFLVHLWNCLIFYFLIGLGYTVFQWIVSLIRLRVEVSNINSFDKSVCRRNADSEEEVILKCKKAKAREIFGDSSYPPKASKLKGLFLYWAIFWPIDLVRSLIGDFLVSGWKLIIGALETFYQAFVHLILPN